VPSRRTQIRMSEDEVLAFLDEQLIVTVASLGPGGRPHLMPLWYVVREGTLWSWTYGKSQKAVNLRRDPRATLQVEAGDRDYGELRGVMLEADTTVHDDLDTVAGVGAELLSRYSGSAVPRDAVAAQAPKRVALEFRETRRVSWDHRKLGGLY
jgi:PPOX class probable F420-dependent enzyme